MSSRDRRSEDDRPAIFLSESGDAFTIFGGSRRPYAGPRYTVGDDGTINFVESTTTHSDGWYTRRYNFNPPPMSDSEKDNYPKKTKPLQITESGRFRGPSGGDLRFRQPAIRAAESYEKDPQQGMVREERASDKWLNSFSTYPTSFSSMLSRLKQKSPKLLTSELFERWAEIREDGIDDPIRILAAWDESNDTVTVPETQEDIDIMTDYDAAVAAVSLAYPDLPVNEMKIILEKAVLSGVNIGDAPSVLAYVAKKTTQNVPVPPPQQESIVEPDGTTSDPQDTVSGSGDSGLEAAFPELSEQQVFELYKQGLASGVVGFDNMVEYIRQSTQSNPGTNIATPADEVPDVPAPAVPVVPAPAPAVPVVPYDDLRQALGDIDNVLSSSELDTEWDNFTRLTGGGLDDDDMLHFIEERTGRAASPTPYSGPPDGGDDEEPYSAPDLTVQGDKQLVPYASPSTDIDAEQDYGGLIPFAPSVASEISTPFPPQVNRSSDRIAPGDIIIVTRF